MALQNDPGKETATLAGGCFWCLEAVYDELRGIERVISGYAGGSVPHPTYEQVCSGRTGHAEVVQVTFDPEVISFREILEVFFTIHDPTTLDRQGADVEYGWRLHRDDRPRATPHQAAATLGRPAQHRCCQHLRPVRCR